MRCPQCQISVRSHFTYCPNCGARLASAGRSYGRIVLFLFVIGIVLAGAAYMRSRRPDIQGRNAPKGLPPAGFHETKNEDVYSSSGFSSSSPETKSPGPGLSVGTVIIYDIAENEIARLPAAVSGSGWVSIPERLCIGGYNWYFYPAGGERLEISGGISGDRDDIGIWQFNNPDALSGPPIFPAKPDQPMIWQSILSDKKGELTGMAIISDQQNFYHISLGESVDEPIVILQNNKIVGWAFGDFLDGAYLWKGADESNLVYELSVYDFYRLTFENSREEQFIVAYSQNEISPARKLETFANGFTRNAMMSADKTPARLKPRAVIAQMRLIMTQIMDQGNPYDITPVFDGNVLSRTGDVDFVMDVLTYCEQIRGPAESIDVLGKVLADPGNFTESQIGQLKNLRKSLYQNWLTLLMNEKEYDKGLQVYWQAADAAIDDPTINLLGVKLALVFDDWKTAGQILHSRQFPINLTDQVRILENQIADLKFQEDKIVIRFTPGSGRIPVTCVLNNRIQQDFIVDTGASMVTIPMAAARQLGIEINENTPVRQLDTVGGVIAAPQVTLDAVSVGGWTEYNVTAYVVDMPNQSGFGLLGLNYLNRFRMDVNTRAGVLTLAPR